MNAQLKALTCQWVRFEDPVQKGHRDPLRFSHHAALKQILRGNNNLSVVMMKRN